MDEKIQTKAMRARFALQFETLERVKVGHEAARYFMRPADDVETMEIRGDALLYNPEWVRSTKSAVISDTVFAVVSKTMGDS